RRGNNGNSLDSRRLRGELLAGGRSRGHAPGEICQHARRWRGTVDPGQGVGRQSAERGPGRADARMARRSAGAGLRVAVSRGQRDSGPGDLDRSAWRHPGEAGMTPDGAFYLLALLLAALIVFLTTQGEAAWQDWQDWRRARQRRR